MNSSRLRASSSAQTATSALYSRLALCSSALLHFRPVHSDDFTRWMFSLSGSFKAWRDDTFVGIQRVQLNRTLLSVPAKAECILTICSEEDYVFLTKSYLISPRSVGEVSGIAVLCYGYLTLRLCNFKRWTRVVMIIACVRPPLHGVCENTCH